MELIRYTQFNLNFMKNLPSDLQNELIIFEGVIPDGIVTTIAFHDEFFKKERGDFINYRPDILSKMYKARAIRHEIAETQGIINARTDENVDFIKKHPKFKKLIKSIVYRDKDLNIVKVVPIDQYLAEN